MKHEEYIPAFGWNQAPENKRKSTGHGSVCEQQNPSCWLKVCVCVCFSDFSMQGAYGQKGHPYFFAQNPRVKGAFDGFPGKNGSSFSPWWIPSVSAALDQHAPSEFGEDFKLNQHDYLGGGFKYFFNVHPYLGKIPILTNIFQIVSTMFFLFCLHGMADDFANQNIHYQPTVVLVGKKHLGQCGVLNDFSQRRNQASLPKLPMFATFFLPKGSFWFVEVEGGVFYVFSGRWQVPANQTKDV